MLRETAALLRSVKNGNESQAAALEVEATRMLAYLMPQLQMPSPTSSSSASSSSNGTTSPESRGNRDGNDGGWWWMLYPYSALASSDHGAGAGAGADSRGFLGMSPPPKPEKSKRVEGRFIHDFLYVGQTINADLNEDERDAMVSFFQRELRTPNFVRAMSQMDPSASSTGSRRADHNQWGSWDGWAGGSITALVRVRV